MSYCRWSDDDYQCDVYVYEDVHLGYVIFLAMGRYVFAEPLPPKLRFFEDPVLWFKREKVVAGILERSTTERIGLPHDGEDFAFGDDAGACAAKLEELRAMGYRVPDYAIDCLKEEAGEGK